jgi:hypothetical protein
LPAPSRPGHSWTIFEPSFDATVWSDLSSDRHPTHEGLSVICGAFVTL